MPSELKFQLCPETGICSIFNGEAGKIDLMPFEVDALRGANGDQALIKSVVAECDANFAEQLTPADLARIGERFH